MRLRLGVGTAVIRVGAYVTQRLFISNFYDTSDLGGGMRSTECHCTVIHVFKRILKAPAHPMSKTDLYL